ncbi:MAG: hypothetical protein C4519_03445 [Desulfobacteraceae bacterium]|nr:MAG: hypothetical protein C4519_03445 [Desulfobacteraceae bacterium]
MVNDFLHKNRLGVYGLAAIFSLLLWTESTCAALLKDIRIGEYDSFTRIVFELDTAVEAKRIQSEKECCLRVVFTNTRPDLVRKIPIKRAAGIKDFQIRTDKNRLSVSFQFIHSHKKVDPSFLDEPPRLIVDVHHLPRSGPGDIHAAILPDSKDRPSDSGTPAEPVPAEEKVFVYPEEPDLPQSLMLEQPKELGLFSSSAVQLTLSDEPPIADTAPASPAPGQKTALQRGPAPSASSARPIAQPHVFQDYLVIGLVIITAGILILLVITLLLSRKGLDDGVPALSTNEHLKHQDARIASLNARIKEQLERYEKA